MAMIIVLLTSVLKRMFVRLTAECQRNAQQCAETTDACGNQQCVPQRLPNAFPFEISGKVFQRKRTHIVGAALVQHVTDGNQHQHHDNGNHDYKQDGACLKRSSGLVFLHSVHGFLLIDQSRTGQLLPR